jgi:hypothetical protein
VITIGNTEPPDDLEGDPAAAWRVPAVDDVEEPVDGNAPLRAEVLLEGWRVGRCRPTACAWLGAEVTGDVAPGDVGGGSPRVAGLPVGAVVTVVDGAVADGAVADGDGAVVDGAAVDEAVVGGAVVGGAVVGGAVVGGAVVGGETGVGLPQIATGFDGPRGEGSLGLPVPSGWNRHP